MSNRWRPRRPFDYPVPTGQVATNVYAVNVRGVNLFCYADGPHAIAIDAAYGGNRLRTELGRIPISPESVTHLFLTHTDVDHTGGLGVFPSAQIHLSRDEEQMIDGTTPRLLGFYHCPRIERQYSLLDDGDIVIAGTIKVQDTINVDFWHQ